MKILMSAFSCGPGAGSEPGIGWNWAVEAARQGHRVHVVTQPEYRDRIEAAIADGKVPANLTFAFFMPGSIAKLLDAGCRAGLEAITWQIVHPLWQIALLAHLRASGDVARFDIVHHITLGGIRHPTLLGRLPVPLVLGPLGGGERAPFALRRSFPWRGWIKDLVRDIHTLMLRIDPITRGACRDAMVVYARTRESLDALPASARPKAGIRLELGIDEFPPVSRPPRVAGAPLKLMYAGQLVYWKGMHLGLRAVAEARRAGHDVRLTMVGSGPEEGAFRRLADSLGLGDAVTWRGQVSHSEMGGLYAAHDALLFPSLHDSSGNVVLESMVRGLPVICLDLCGPAEMVTPASGRIVATCGKGEADAVAGLAAAIAEIDRSPELNARLSDGALLRSRQFLWPVVVASLYADVEKRLAAAAAERSGHRARTPAIPAE